MSPRMVSPPFQLRCAGSMCRLARRSPGRDDRPTALRADRPLVRPSDEGESEPPFTERLDYQPAACVGHIRLHMARRTERHQAVAIEVRAPLATLLDVMHLETVA